MTTTAAILKYEVKIDVQMEFSPDISLDDQYKRLQEQGKMFIELGLMGQELREKDDKMRENLHLIPTLVPHFQPIVELIE